MAFDIRPLSPVDLPELSQFLSAGFHAPASADFIAPEVLQWKYFEPLEPDPIDGAAGSAPAASPVNGALRSYVARDEAGRIVGHLGMCRTAFEGGAIAPEAGPVGTIDYVDWLGSPGHRSVGLSLLRMAHNGSPTQFGLGATAVALAVGERAGYEPRSLVPVYSRVLRAGRWLRTGRGALAEIGLRLARDALTLTKGRSAVAPAPVVLERVSGFGPEILPIVERARTRAILTSRDPARLNSFLRFPRQAISGWHLRDESGRLRGLALLNVIPGHQGRRAHRQNRRLRARRFHGPALAWRHAGPDWRAIAPGR